MPVTGFSIGHDVTVDITDPTTGVVVSWGNPTGFNAKPITKRLNSEPLNTFPLFGEVPNGWEGHVEFDRTGPVIDQFFANLEASYWSGSNTLVGQITETIREDSGAITQWVYIGVAMKFDDPGMWKAAEKVPQKITWVAGTRLAIV